MFQNKSSLILQIFITLIIFSTPILSFADVPEEPNVNDKSLFYNFILMAETGGDFTSLGDAPSINRSGVVAFQAQNASGQGVWSSDGLTTTDLTPGFDGPSRAFQRAVMLSDVGNAIESDRLSGALALTQIRIWAGDGSGAFTILGLGGAGRPYDAVLSHPALSANGNAWAFTALVPGPGSGTRKLVTPLGEAELLGNQGAGYRPMVADDGTVVLHDTDGILRQIQVVRGGDPNNFDVVISDSNGFTQLGSQPGISDSGEIIAFSGDRGNGPGVFIAYESVPGARTVVRVAGEGALPQGNRPDLGFDENDNPVFFSSIDFNSRVAVLHQERGSSGLDGDTVIVAFVGTPSGSSTYPRFGHYPGLFFRQALGIWTVRLDFHLDSASTLQMRKRYAIPVAQVGDTLLNGFVIASLAVHDPLAEATSDDFGNPLQYPAGSHRIAFWASNSAGKQVILRGTHVNSCLLTVRHFSQCDARWENELYVATTDDFCAKACALTTQTMAANHGADFYDITDTWTPLQVHDFIRPRRGFLGNSVNWSRSIQSLRQVPGLLSLEPNTLRFTRHWTSVLPTSSAAHVNAALTYIDGNLCDTDNPAPVVLGADRERVQGRLVPGHFILQSGRVNNRRFISDPGYAAGILFSQGPANNPISTRYDRNFETRGVVIDPVDLGGMTIAVDGAATLLVTNASGQRAGYVAGSEEPVQEIVDGVFFFDGLRNLTTQIMGDEDFVSSFHIPSSGVASYTVQAIGLQTGNFTLTVDTINPDGSLNSPASLTEAIEPGQIKTYTVTPTGGGAIVPSAVTVPDVVNQPQANAEAALTAAGLTVGTVTQQSSATVPTGMVISQTPTAGQSVASGSSVNLVVSSGPALVTVPNVVNQPQANAEAALTAAGLTVGTVTQQSSTTIPSGAVISQNPTAGQAVASGSPVNLIVSSGTLAGDLDGNGKVDCTDLAIVKASYGKRSSQLGFDARADVNQDGIVDVRDLSFVSQKLPAGTHCS